MRAPKWLIIARNEYRIRTSSIRGIRPYFPYLLLILLGGYVFYVAPKIVGLFVNEFVAFFLSQVAVPMMQILLFMFFFIFITFPISYALKDVKTSQQELFISAPIKSSSVLLGEFLGELPLYGVMIVVITGLFTAILDPLGLNAIQKIMIILIFILVFSSALWIGTVITALLRTRFGRTSRGKDIGKALSVLIVLPALGVMYAVMGGKLFEILADPRASGIVKTALGWLPSSWGADIFTTFASSSGNSTAMAFETLIRFGGLIIFFVASVWVGIKVADRAYSLETATFTASRARPDGIFYRTLKKLGKGSFSTLFVSVFKVYTRTLQNLSWIVYVVGLLALLTIFFVRPDDNFDVLMPSLFLTPMLAAVVASDITLRGKETLFIYRKTPHGESRLLKAMLLKGWIVAVPIAAVIMAISTWIGPQATIISLGVNTGLMMVIIAADVVFASGLFLLVPAYSEKGGEFVLNMMIVVWISIGLAAASFFFFEEPIHEFMGISVFHWIVGIVVLFIGKMRLNSIE
jgi:hypothetical protein